MVGSHVVCYAIEKSTFRGGKCTIGGPGIAFAIEVAGMSAITTSLEFAGCNQLGRRAPSKLLSKRPGLKPSLSLYHGWVRGAGNVLKTPTYSFEIPLAAAA